MLYHKIKKNERLFIFGHRGAPQRHHENSLNSIKAAIQLGAHGIEFDVQITQDQQIILFHDDFIVSDNHKKYFIHHTPYSKIKSLCAKKHIPHPALFKELVPIIISNPQIVFNIEIKSQRWNNFIILKSLINTTPLENLKNQCIISSFNVMLLYQLKFQFSYCYSMAYILASKKINNWGAIAFNKILICFLKPHFFHMNIKYLTNHLVSWAHNRKMFINTYTVNDVNTVNKCIDLNVDGIFTDNEDLYIS